nr:acyl-ACP thioesterase domain-containing protein [Streptococcus sp. X13SY08]
MTKKVSFLGLRYKETVIIPFDMVDMTHQIKLSNFISYCLVVSGRQSASLGRSDIEIFEAYGVVWVVTDYELNINRLPLYNERVTIETEALSYNKFFCYRKFFIYDESGDLLLDILCYFVLIDFETRQLVPVPDDLVAPYQSEKIKKVHRAPKLATLNEPNVQEYHVRYFDIDMNGHVNNGKYFEWMYDVLDVEFLTHHVPTKIALKYVKEVSPGGTIESQHFLDMAELVSHHAIVAEGQVRAQARMEWRKENGRNG